jgi:alkanesulfonate monooxygenase
MWKAPLMPAAATLAASDPKEGPGRPTALGPLDSAERQALYKSGSSGKSTVPGLGEMTPFSTGLELFATCPQSKDMDADAYRPRVSEVAGWADRAGYRGILIYTDNQLVDPWLVAQIVIESSERVSPLVAIQPVYMHPYTAAKMVSSLGHLYGRQVFLNMVAGGFRNDLRALADHTEHADRYARLVEYTLLMKRLLKGERVSFSGTYYTVERLSLTPPLAPDLFPRIFVSGSSQAGVAAARAIGATAVKYPKPPNEEMSTTADGAGIGIRVGVIARDDDSQAWKVARARFPEDRRGQVTHGLAMKVSDSHWHRQLSELGTTPPSAENPYWLGPFENYKTFCPYLVGSYDTVAVELARYIDLGFGTFIVDIPPDEEELGHTALAFEHAARHATA